MIVDEHVQKILDKFDRDETDFKNLIDFFATCDNPLAVKWAESAVADISHHNEQVVVNAKKRVKMLSRVGTITHPEVGSINVDKKMETVREIVVPVDVLVYKDFLTGLYKFEFSMPKNFMLGREDYDADPIARFNGMDVKEKKDYGHIFLVFIKEFNFMEYLTIEDLLIEPKTDEDREFINSKPILTFNRTVTCAEQIVSKTIEFTAIVEDIIKKFMLSGF